MFYYFGEYQCINSGSRRCRAGLMMLCWPRRLLAIYLSKIIDARSETDVMAFIMTYSAEMSKRRCLLKRRKPASYDGVMFQIDIWNIWFHVALRRRSIMFMATAAIWRAMMDYRGHCFDSAGFMSFLEVITRWCGLAKSGITAMLAWAAGIAALLMASNLRHIVVLTTPANVNKLRRQFWLAGRRKYQTRWRSSDLAWRGDEILGMAMTKMSAIMSIEGRASHRNFSRTPGIFTIYHEWK